MNDRLHSNYQYPATRNVALCLVLLRDVRAGELIAATRHLDVEKESLTEIADHFEDYRTDILRFLRRRVDNPEQSEDLMQQVFLRMMERSN